MDKNITKKFIHIGFGKCGSSKLQKDIFPAISEFKNLNYWGDEYKNKSLEREMMQTSLLNHVTRTELGKETRPIKIEKDYLISNEELSSYRDADLINFFAENNLKAFGQDSHIILVIREPRDWLSSVYIQLCIHEKPLQKPDTFFLDDIEYSSRLPDQKFNIDKFSYQKIIEKYKGLFQTFTFIKFESLGNMEALSEIFLLDKDQKSHLKDLYKNKYVNKSISKFAYKILWKISSILTLFNLSFANKYNNHIYLERSNYKFVDNPKIKKKSLIRQTIRNIFNYKIFQKYIDKVIKYEKYMINFDLLKKINIEKLEKEYKGLPDYKTYDKND